jgi:NitT/TauT family transport system ATP-binding protein
MAQLQFDQVSLAYTMARTGEQLAAVTDCSLTVASGSFVALIGPSGCGKSSLLNAVAGLLPPQRGQVLLDGRPISGPTRSTGYVFQQSALLPWRSVLRNVAYGLELHGVDRRTAAERARRFIRLVGLNGFEESFPHELSGGMQQRANLARALAVEPQLLLCDEPLAALDAQTREAMQLELQRIWLAQPQTVLFVTHQISEALLLADRIIVMSPRPGRIIADLAVPLPRPRSLHDLRGDVCLQLEDQIRRLLTSQAAPEPAV